MSSTPCDIDLLMIGKTGNGKSALGNTILNRKMFYSRSSTASVTKEIQYEVSEVNGRVIKVVDGPGVGDTRMDNEKSTRLVMDAMSYAISVNPKGYHAFLLVVKFGGRFTVEDQDTIAFLKKIFGESFVKDFCILVMTCGDNFESDSEETGKTFHEWCQEQEGVFHELLQECNGRVLLFDNRTKDEEKKSKQITELIQMVDHLTVHGHRYKDDNFEKARKARERVIVEAKKPMIREETMRETSLIIQKLQVIQGTMEPENRKASLGDLLIRAETLYGSINTQDNGTGALHDLVQTVLSLKNTIQDEIKLSERVAEEKEKMKIEEAKRQKEFEELLRRQREEYEEQLKKERLEDEKRRAVQMEQENRIRDMEHNRRLERERIEREQLEQLEKERRENQQKTEVLERKYLEAKAKNDEGFLDKIVNFVTWPFRQIFG
ncbi:uncharacterized protein LOC106065861 [Biomphalaria glabrata]|uniref:Uncharacterized protein LOC106065861 n=1 Tax=Biomphalaria glabrata TaxID=6526 RepID=A0A9W2Z3J2_BIOGL|nr:uncharacterized protein LOC106065861 [Biomphalaria glabrata]XP_055869565.1 uncharacterized protein LOC106065861 [Biomphalaria glabrata]